MAYVALSPAALAAMLAGPGLVPLIDADPDGALLTFYGGAIPAPGGTPATAAQAELRLARPSGTLAGTQWTLAAPLETMRMGAEPMTWARVLSGGSWVMDLDVTANGINNPGTGTPGAIQLDDIAGYPGGTVRILTGSIGYA